MMVRQSIGLPGQYKMPLDPDYESDYDSDDDEDENPKDPYVNTCFCCCNLGIGVILGALFFLIFDSFFLIRKSTTLFNDERDGISPVNFGMKTASIILNAFSCLSSFILMASACLCGTPERSTSMRFLSRYWIFTLGLNTVYQVIETLINTLPDPDSIFVVSMPSLGFPEIMGPPAIVITWLFTSVYLFGYLYMCLICVSYTRELNVSRFSKEVKISGKHRRIAAQIPSYDDIQSNTTYMERLSDMSREMSDDVYQEVAPSDMTGLDDIYARKSGLKRSPSPRILQAQLAYLSPQQRVQFLQQLGQGQGMPGQMGPLPPPPGPNGLPGMPLPPGAGVAKKQTDNESQISSSSKPNSNGYNVRFGPDTKPDPEDMQKQQQMQQIQMIQAMMAEQANKIQHHQAMQAAAAAQAAQSADQRFSPNVTAPPYGPRPEAYSFFQPQLQGMPQGLPQGMPQGGHGPMGQMGPGPMGQMGPVSMGPNGPQNM